MTRRRRIVITVCPNEPGVVRLPVEPGGRAKRLDARAIARALETAARQRGAGDRVTLREACAGGCTTQGPNVTVTIYPEHGADHVAIGWKTYVYSLPTLDYLAQVIDDNIEFRKSGRSTQPPRT